MNETDHNIQASTQVTVADQAQPVEAVSIPEYRRDLNPNNLVLSADDLKEFCQVLADANSKARELEYRALVLGPSDTSDEARERIDRLMPIEYRYAARNGDSVQGLGLPRTEERQFPDDLSTFFASNSSYAQRTINNRPMNVVDAFLSFEKPSLKLDFYTMPSNPTDNRSIINVAGRDEDWVISTTQKIDEFLKKRRAVRPIIHKSGTYDYFIYLAFLPVAIWLFYKQGAALAAWLNEQSMFLNVILGIYAILLTLLLARFVFQYVRWLFPPMEYYKRHRWGAFVHRSAAAAIGTAVVLGASYDLIKVLVQWLLS